MAIVLSLCFSCASEIPRLHSARDAEGISISEGNTKILFYQVQPKSSQGKYARAGYIHPLYTLAGTAITEDFPQDHPHHHGIYSAWHQIIIRDTIVADGWTAENISWDVTNVRTTRKRAQLKLMGDIFWKVALGEARSEPIVREALTVTIYPTKGRIRMIDYDFTLTALRDELKIGGSDDEKGYGGFSLRLKLPEDIRFVSEGGEVEPQVGSVNAGPWMNFSGLFYGSQAARSGVVVLSHPTNPGHPQPWILRNQKSMQNAAFPGRHPVALTPEGLSFRYRIVVYEGELQNRAIQEMYREYSSS